MTCRARWSVSNEQRAVKAEAVLALVEKFVVDQRITCAETISQSDRVIVAAYDFIEALCDVAGYKAEDGE
jgi:hypothetical protein